MTDNSVRISIVSEGKKTSHQFTGIPAYDDMGLGLCFNRVLSCHFGEIEATQAFIHCLLDSVVSSWGTSGDTFELEELKKTFSAIQERIDEFAKDSEKPD